MSRVIERLRAWFGPITITRTGIATGLATTAAMLVPVTVGYMVGRLELGLGISLGALVVALADTGGSYRVRARWMLAATLLGAVVGVISGLAGANVWVSAPLSLLLVAAFAMFSVFGNEAARLGTALAYTVVIMASLPITSAEAVERFWTYVAGGLFAMFFTLLLWPVRPLGPAAEAVAEYYRSVGAFLEQMAELLRAPDGNVADWEVRTEPARTAVFTHLQAARSVGTAERAGRAGASPSTERLVELISTLNRLYGWTLSFSASIAIISAQPEFSRLRGALADHYQAIANAVEAFSSSTAGSHRRIDQPAVQAVLDAHAQCCRELRDLIAGMQDQNPQLAAELAQLAEEAQRLHDLLTRAAAQLLNEIELEPQEELAQQPRRSWRSVWEMLRANLSTHSTTARHALRVGIAVALGIIVYSVFHLEHGFWITFAIVAVMKPDVGGSRSFIAKRVTATVIGGIVVAAMVYVAPNVDVMVLLLWPIALIGFTILGVNYRVGIIFFTMFIVMLVDLGTPGNWELAGLRILNTLIGGTIALAASYVLWPTWQRTLVPGELADAVDVNRAYLEHVLAADRDPTAIRELSRRAHVTNSNTAVAFQKLLSEPRRQRGNTELLYALETHNRRITVATTALDLQLSLPDVQLPDPAALRTELDAALRELAQAIRSQQPASHPFELDAAYRALLQAAESDAGATLAVSEIGLIMDAVDGMAAVTQVPRPAGDAAPQITSAPQTA